MQKELARLRCDSLSVLLLVSLARLANYQDPKKLFFYWIIHEGFPVPTPTSKIPDCPPSMASPGMAHGPLNPLIAVFLDLAYLL